VRRRAFFAAALALGAEALEASEAFPDVTPGRALQFPRDHGSHPEFRTEWWYITGWVGDRRGREVGVQITFFRSRPNVAEANPSAFAPRQIVFAHAALADASHGRLRHDQRAARVAFDLAGADTATTRVWIRDWALRLERDVDTYAAKIVAREFALDLTFVATQPLLLQGEQGYSRKGPLARQASYYYSRPHLRVRGTIDVGAAREPVEGAAWLDHEWSSEYLASGAVGWDWIGVNLDDGGALMAFRIRDRSGNAFWAGGARRHADGRTETLSPQDVSFEPQRSWTSPRTGHRYPVAMRVRAGGIDYDLVPLMDDQELDSRATTGTVYWEGAVTASAHGKRVGRGYLELTGYGEALRI
jgi:predicted secreted hydrolase